jgi:hypothetical protein
MDPQIRIQTKTKWFWNTALSVSGRWLQYNVIYCRDPQATTVYTAIKEVGTPAQLSKPGVKFSRQAGLVLQYSGGGEG